MAEGHFDYIIDKGCYEVSSPPGYDEVEARASLLAPNIDKYDIDRL